MYEELKEINLSNRFYNRVWAIPVSKMYYEILNKNLDYYSFENIILPATETLTADEVNKLYFRLISKKEVFEKKVTPYIGIKRIEYIRKKYPNAVNLYRKLMSFHP